MKHLLILALTN